MIALDELSMIRDGELRWDKQEEQLSKNGILTSIDTKLTKGALPLVSEVMLAELENAKTQRGVKPFWFSALSELDTDLSSYIGLNYAFIGVGQQTDVTNICINIGKAICVELWSKNFQETNKPLFDRLFKMAVNNHNSPRHRLKAVSAVAQREGHGLNRWSAEQNLNVGQAVLNAVLIGSKLFETFEIPRKNGKSLPKQLGLTELGYRIVSELKEDVRWMSPIFKPMLQKPKPWTSFDSGAYHNEKLASLVPLVRMAPHEQRARINIRTKSGQMDRVFASLNAIQETPLAINKVVLDQVKFAWENNHILKKFPRSAKLSVPGKVKDWDELDQAQRKKVKKNKEAIILRNRAIVADVVNFTSDLQTAEELAKHDRFYQPHNLDKRGRVYPVPTFNHQRADHIRAMFQFADGKPLGERGIYWLAIHLANCGDFGKVSKKSFDDRVQWVNDNSRAIYCIGKKPGLTRAIWYEADKPFSFLAACVEFAGYMDHGPSYVSYIPCALDGTNSGVQHYCAALRDAEGGATVNLVPQNKPADVYQIVADNVLDQINCDINDPDLAQMWLKYGVSRSVVKRNVMTFAYASEKFGFKQQQMEDLMKPLSDEVLEGIRSEHPFGSDDGHKAAAYMADKVWKAVNQVVNKAAVGMKFIQRCASVLAHEAKPLTWTTPIGLPVVHAYKEWEINRVRIYLYDKEIQVADKSVYSKVAANGNDVYNCIMCNIRTKPKGTIDKTKQRNAAAPNFIHSLDASHLMFTALAGKQHGMDDFLLIHDSFATHMADTDEFFYLIREQFVAMYEQFDVFQMLFDSTYEALSEDGKDKLESPPEKGDLVIRGVLESDYAFA